MTRTRIPDADADVIDYDDSMDVQALKVGYPIYHQGVYATIRQIITDPAMRQVVLAVTGEDDGQARVFYVRFGEMVDVGAVRQYGIDPGDGKPVKPTHVNHGHRALSMARAYARAHGGRVMVRRVVPDDMRLTGGLPLGDFQPLD